MAARIRLATSASDVDDALRLRHTVYATHGGYMPTTPDGRIVDRFDAYPGAYLFVAYIGAEIVGTTRLIVDTGIGTHVDEFMDFSPYVPQGARVGSGSMLCVHQDFRSRHKLAMSLVGMCMQQAVGLGLTHILGAVNPKALDGFRSVGFQPLTEPRHSEEKGVDYVPVILDLTEMTERFTTFVRRDEGLHIVRNAGRLFLEEGEELFREGDRGTEAYLVLDGALQLRIENRLQPLPRLERGAWLGELAALLDRPRSASAFAARDCDLLVVPRDLLLAEARRDPEVALDLLRQVAGRLWDSTRASAGP